MLKKVIYFVILLGIMSGLVYFSSNKEDKSEIPVSKEVSTFLEDLSKGNAYSLGITDEEIKTDDDNYANEKLFIRGVELMCKTSIKSIKVLSVNKGKYNISVSGYKVSLVKPDNLKDSLLNIEKNFESGKITEGEVKDKIVDCIYKKYNINRTKVKFEVTYELHVNSENVILNKYSFIKELLEITDSAKALTEYQDNFDTVREEVRRELSD